MSYICGCLGRPEVGRGCPRTGAVSCWTWVLGTKCGPLAEHQVFYLLNHVSSPTMNLFRGRWWWWDLNELGAYTWTPHSCDCMDKNCRRSSQTKIPAQKREELIKFRPQPRSYWPLMVAGRGGVSFLQRGGSWEAVDGNMPICTQAMLRGLSGFKKQSTWS